MLNFRANLIRDNLGDVIFDSERILNRTFARHSDDIQTVELQNALKPKFGLRLAVIEDNLSDFRILSHQMTQSDLLDAELDHFDSVDAFLKMGRHDSYDVIVLDRFIQSAGLTEGRIRDIKYHNPKAGIVMYTGSSTPSLRGSAVHEGAMLVVEKGTLSVADLELLFLTAARFGAKVSN
ncbi:MAG: hypothetical protein CMK07_15190 [Ponticaulis sp.]|nr:hypothetical protein [Ponticaulis sp.]